MDLGSINATGVLDAVAKAWSDVAALGEAAEGAVPASGSVLAGPEAVAEAAHPTASQPLALGGFVERILGEVPHSAAAVPPAPSGGPLDHGPETASLQTFARPHAPASEAPRPVNSALPSASHAKSEFAIPADQLIPVTLIGLQVEPAWSWPLPRRGFDAAPAELAGAPHEALHDRDEVARLPLDDEGRGEPDDAAHDGEPGDAHQADALALDDPADTDWCAPLSRALCDALAAKVPPQALLAAAAQWHRGRCVVLACPQGADPAGPAWAFVLWPRSRAFSCSTHPAPAAALPLALFGLRVEARLQWSALARDVKWCHVRVVKEHHPRRGRQLISLEGNGAPGEAPAAPAAPACEVQLGPVLARSLHWCQVCVRINAVRRFWTALGAQWSATVVVCSLPLAGTREPNIVEAT